MLAKVGLLGRSAKPATIGEVIAAFEADCAGRGIQTATGSSGYKAVRALRLVLKTVHGLVGDGPVDALPATVLTAELLQDFQARRVAAALREGPAAVQTARITAASTINQARMVVSGPAMREEQMRRLGLPDLEDFRAWRPAATTRKVRVPVDDVTLQRLRDEVDNLWLAADAGDDQARARWLAVALAGNMGLRRGSGVMARWSWVRLVGGKARIYILATDEAEPKGNEYSVEIEPSVWEDMQALRRVGMDYIVPGATAGERDAAFAANVEWLRGLGLNVDKPNHELRAVFLQAMDRVHGRQAASDAAGHDKPRTTEIYTGRGRSGHSVRAL
jgi:integrase